MHFTLRGHKPARQRAARRRTGAVAAIAAALAVLVSATIIGPPGQSAAAADYPSWSDVQAARTDLKAAETKIAQLDALLAALQSAVTSSAAAAKQKGDEWQAAQQKYDEAAFKAGELQKQADVSQAKADKSKQKAGQIAARLARAGGSDLSVRLFFNSAESKNLLSQLGLASMVKDQSSGLYEKAKQDQNLAQSQTDQAVVARSALKKLAAAAQVALDAAAVAAQKAGAALTEQDGNKERLEAQRAVLASNSAATEADYNAGVAVRAKVAAVAKAAAEAQAAAATRAAVAYAAANPGVRTADNGGSSVSPNGWIRPSTGQISSPFGWRVNPYTGASAPHAGIDLAPGCGAPILAAHAGVVIYAGPNGGYGNFILLNNGDGISTGYGHIVEGGIMVAIGERVTAGEQIARVGSTGNSTGCHLHFEVRPDGTAIDPAPFMSARGATLG